MKKICATCKFAELGVTASSPSSKEDGVNCHNERMAQFMDCETGFAHDYRDEFKEHGSINLFRIKVVADDCECELWEGK